MAERKVTLLILAKVTQHRTGVPLDIRRRPSPVKLAHASVADYRSWLTREAVEVSFLLENGGTTVITSHLRLDGQELARMLLCAKP